MVFAFTVFVSKAAVNISSGVVLLFALIDMVLNGTYREMGKNRFFWAFLIPLAIGLTLSLFSDAGLKGPGFFLERFRFFFVFIPFLIFIRNKNHLLCLYLVLCASGCSAALYGFFNADKTGSSLLFEGLHIVGRNSDLFTSLGLMSCVFLFHIDAKSVHLKYFLRVSMFITAGFSVASIIFINQLSLFVVQRGALLGLCTGFFFYTLFFNRKILLIIMIPLAIGIQHVGFDHPLIQRIKTIGDLETHTSNVQRLHLLGAGIPYVIDRHLLTGTGSKKPDKDFSDFFTKKDKGFQTRYSQAMENSGNFHNSYLQMAAENGALFLLIYLSGMFCVFFMITRNLEDPDWRMFRIGALTVTTAASVTYFFHGELYRYGGLLFYLVLLGGCLGNQEQKSLPSDEAFDPHPVGGSTLYSSNGPVHPAS